MKDLCKDQNALLYIIRHVVRDKLCGGLHTLIQQGYPMSCLPAMQIKVKKTYSRRSSTEALPKTLRSPTRKNSRIPPSSPHLLTDLFRNFAIKT